MSASKSSSTSSTSAKLSIPVPLHLFTRPAGAPAEGRPPILLALHGYAMTGDTMLALVQRMVSDDFLIVSIEGPHSTIVPGTESGPERKIGFHWGVTPLVEEVRTTHRACVQAAIRWAVDEGGDPERVSLLAFSQPCSFNYRVAVDPPHGHPFRALVALCGGPPGEWSESDPGARPVETPVETRNTGVLHVSTREDPFYPMDKVQTFRGRLLTRFSRVDHVLYDGGHRVPSESFQRVREFLSELG